MKTDIFITLGLAFEIWLGVIVFGFYNYRVLFLSSFMHPGAPLVLSPRLIIIEIASNMSRPIDLGMRLAANLTAGYILMTISGDFGCKLLFFTYGFFPLFPILIILFMTVLEISVLVIQGYVFCLLSMIYLNDSILLHWWKRFVYHPYYLVDPSPWPYVMACGALLTTLGAVVYFHYSQLILLFSGVNTIVFCLNSTIVFCLPVNVVRETTFQGNHTRIAVKGLKIGFLLFIISEVPLSFSFLQAFFHSSLSPSVEIGVMLPPLGIDPLIPFSVPLLNTAILLSSRATVTWTHHSIVSRQKSEAISGFTMSEDIKAPFKIADSVYGTTFFVAMGFHGLHVTIGMIFLRVCLMTLVLSHFTRSHYFGFEAASWYWHFVDIV